MQKSDQKQLTVRVWRGGESGAFETFKVPRQENQTVLDVVTHIQRRLDPSLTYRFACRVGVCGSCAMTVNGRGRWTCRSNISAVAPDGKLELAPLRNLPIVKDLMVDMAVFFDKLAAAGGRFEAADPNADDFATVEPDSKARRMVEAAIECIGCGVCYAACDLVASNPDYLGPAALNRAWTLCNDVRDGHGPQILRLVANGAGCLACHSQQSCQEYCPKHLSPTRSIAGLKKAAALAALKGGL
ncbi:MAG: 2Fe-2S iron-sulfur cluster-binding protein [Alphaproteobacteria bacterium]|nr:2Fe-2S iron-sulfur cluster-binding protein [Alphaproteobacteria bacterium]